MPTYIFLTRFTREGIVNVEASPERTDEAIDHIESLGGTFKDFYIVTGRFDGVLIADFPDDETAAAAALALGSSGNVTTETLRGFDLDEYRDILARVEEAH